MYKRSANSVCCQSVAVYLKPLYCFLFDIYTGGGLVITWKEKGCWHAAAEIKFRCINHLLPSSSFSSCLIIFTFEVMKYTSRENCVGKCPQSRHKVYEEGHCSLCSVVTFHCCMFYKVVTACTSGFPIIISCPNKKEPL